LKRLIEKLRAGEDLNSNDVSYAVGVLLSERASLEGKATFLTALHDKGETPEEIAAFVQCLLDRAIQPEIDAMKLPGPLIDICGTGGAGLGLFNVSTTIMFILAAGGAVVAKHGSRGVTSPSGSADILEALGVKISWEPEELARCLERVGLCFLYARQYHSAYRVLAEIRENSPQALQRTVFNMLGPLLNPMRPPHQLIGVFAPRLTTLFAEVLRRHGRTRAWVVHGLADDGTGMDDISISGPTTLAELENGRVSTAVLDTRWLGVREARLEELRGGGPMENAKILTGILSGEVQGAKRDLAVVNAAGGFVVAGLARDVSDGIALAREQLDSGRALEKLKALQAISA
jgi:anthranilate phosphoribosyltransferase